jgi:hypothetical protein
MAILQAKRLKRKEEKQKLIISEKESTIRELEKCILGLKRKLASFTEDHQDFDTFGNSNITNNCGTLVTGKEEEQDPVLRDLHMQYQRRLKELEDEIEDLRSQEDSHLDSLLFINQNKMEHFENQLDIQEDSIVKACLDCIAILSYQLTESEIMHRDSSKVMVGNSNNTMMSSQLNQSFAQFQTPGIRNQNETVEFCQRLVIRYLSKTMNRIVSNNSNINLDEASIFDIENQGDRTVWYIELLESQLGKIIKAF